MKIKIEETASREGIIFRIKGRQKIHEDYGLWVIAANANVKSPTHHEPIPRIFDFYSISHLTKGHAWLWIKGKGTQNVEAGSAIIMGPGIIHDYSAYDCYEEDLVCFSGPVADYLAKCGIIETGVIPLGKMRRLLPICELAADPSRDSQIKINMALQNLLVELYLRHQKTGNRQRYSLMDNLLQAIIAHPDQWWPVSKMAEMTNLSKNQLIRVFSKHTGLTPKHYIDQLKIKLASEILLNSDESLASIASRLGYNDQFHFSKRFKALNGLSPSNYRKYRFKARMPS